MFASPACVVNVSAVQSPSRSVSHTTGPSTSAAAADTAVGERVLRATRVDREQKSRLRQIEHELARLTSGEVTEVRYRPCNVVQSSIGRL